MIKGIVVVVVEVVVDVVLVDVVLVLVVVGGSVVVVVVVVVEVVDVDVDVVGSGGGPNVQPPTRDTNANTDTNPVVRRGKNPEPSLKPDLVAHSCAHPVESSRPRQVIPQRRRGPDSTGATLRPGRQDLTTCFFDRDLGADTSVLIPQC
jgi:hypothetical protein